MDVNGLVRMLMKLFGNRLIGMVMNKGMDAALGAQKPKHEMTGEEKAQWKAGKAQSRRMRQAMKVGKKLW